MFDPHESGLRLAVGPDVREPGSREQPLTEADIADALRVGAEERRAAEPALTGRRFKTSAGTL